jgi:hypothetical protein
MAVAVAAQAAFGVELFEQGLGVLAAEAEGVADGGDGGLAVALGEGDDQPGQLLVGGGGGDDVGLGADRCAGAGLLAEGALDFAPLGAKVCSGSSIEWPRKAGMGALRRCFPVWTVLKMLLLQRNFLLSGWLLRTPQ